MLIILTGPAGAGKSTVGEKLAYSFPRSVNFSLDDLRHFVKGGYVHPWDDTDEEGQSTLATDVAMDMIGKYLAKNFVVIIDDQVDDEHVRQYADRFGKTYAFRLLPSLEELRRRDAGRPEHKQLGEYAAEMHRDHAEKRSELIQTIDSTDQTPEETADEIKSLITKASHGA